MISMVSPCATTTDAPPFQLALAGVWRGGAAEIEPVYSGRGCGFAWVVCGGLYLRTASTVGSLRP